LLKVAGFVLSKRERRAAMTSEVGRTTNLPPGYRLDLIGDPCVIAVLREDGTVVARFTHNVDPEEIRRAAEEDHQAIEKSRTRLQRSSTGR
jgi:hypothetical protein